jgi:hypothetical protein
MIVTVGSMKSGAGKSKAGRRACLGASPGRAGRVAGRRGQQTTIPLRAEAGRLPAPACVWFPNHRMLGPQMRSQARRDEVVVLDAGGRYNLALRTAVQLCDVLLVPVRPRSADVWALADMAQVIDEVSATREGLRAYSTLRIPGYRRRRRRRRLSLNSRSSRCPTGPQTGTWMLSRFQRNRSELRRDLLHEPRRRSYEGSRVHCAHDLAHWGFRQPPSRLLLARNPQRISHFLVRIRYPTDATSMSVWRRSQDTNPIGPRRPSQQRRSPHRRRPKQWGTPTRGPRLLVVRSTTEHCSSSVLSSDRCGSVLPYRPRRSCWRLH